MRRSILVDTGPLVALLDRRDQNHVWSRDQFGRFTSPLLTCEAVIAEACYLLRHFPPAAANVLEMIDRGEILLPFDLAEEASRVRKLMLRYADVPMALADACLVRMTEMHEESEIFTADRDFTIYRKNGRQVIPTILPHD